MPLISTVAALAERLFSPAVIVASSTSGWRWLDCLAKNNNLSTGSNDEDSRRSTSTFSFVNGSKDQRRSGGPTTSQIVGGGASGHQDSTTTTDKATTSSVNSAALLTEKLLRETLVSVMQKMSESVINIHTPETDSPIEFYRIHETDLYELCLFVLKKGQTLPIHDHPQMTVFSKVVAGDLLVKSFELLPSHVSSPVKGGRVVRVTMNRIIKASNGPDSVLTIIPGSGPNLHSFTAMSDYVIIMDLLGPRYNDTDRICSYFKLSDARVDILSDLGTSTDSIGDDDEVEIEGDDQTLHDEKRGSRSSRRRRNRRKNKKKQLETPPVDDDDLPIPSDSMMVTDTSTASTSSSAPQCPTSRVSASMSTTSGSPDSNPGSVASSDSTFNQHHHTEMDITPITPVLQSTTVSISCPNNATVSSTVTTNAPSARPNCTCGCNGSLPMDQEGGLVLLVPFTSSHTPPNSASSPSPGSISSILPSPTTASLPQHQQPLLPQVPLPQQQQSSSSSSSSQDVPEQEDPFEGVERPYRGQRVHKQDLDRFRAASVTDLIRLGRGIVGVWEDVVEAEQTAGNASPYDDESSSSVTLGKRKVPESLGDLKLLRARQLGGSASRLSPMPGQ